jgi:membrane protein implicated in regulation of membrane protease activity
MLAGLLSLWWVWLCAALALGVVELLVPGTIFLGFSLGALVMAVIVAVFPAPSVAAMLALFAALSLGAWLVLRLVFRRQSSGARIVERDINEG